MEFEWNAQKRARNIAKHGVDFDTIRGMNWETALRFVDSRENYGEIRYVALGFIETRLHVCVYTERNGSYRIISLRKANLREEALYEEKTADE